MAGCQHYFNPLTWCQIAKESADNWQERLAIKLC